MVARPSRVASRLRSRRTWFGGAAVVVLAGLNAPAVLGFARERYHAYEIETDGYKSGRGHWDVVAMPEQFQLNSIHAVLLRTGKVLLIAGSGNNVKLFEGGTWAVRSCSRASVTQTGACRRKGAAVGHPG